MRLPVVAMLLLVSLAGCTDDSKSTQPGAPVAMDSTWDAAMAAIAKSDGTYVLESIVGLEYSQPGTTQVDGDDPDVAVWALVDEDRGDGLAQLWRYRFSDNATGEVRNIFVGENGVVRNAADIDGERNSNAEHVTRPALDSTAVMDIFWDEVGDAYAVTANTTIGVRYWGAPCGPQAIVLGFEDLNDDPTMAMFIDATTGQVTGVGFTVVCPGPLGETVAVPFTITALQGDSGSFTLETDHKQITFTVAFTGTNPPNQDAVATVTGPNGSIQVPLDGSDVVMQDAAAGDYTVAFAMRTGVRMEGNFYGCTGGFIYRPGNEPNVAC